MGTMADIIRRERYEKKVISLMYRYIVMAEKRTSLAMAKLHATRTAHDGALMADVERIIFRNEISKLRGEYLKDIHTCG